MVFLSDTLLSVMVGGIIGFGSGIGVKLVQEYITRPILFGPGKLRGQGVVGWTIQKVRWMIPKDDFTVTINADDTEYIDLCVTRRRELGGWEVIFTTERGYGKEQKDAPGLVTGREPIRLFLRVSASNAKQCVKNIWISPTPDDQDDQETFVVYFSHPQE